jgi:hypothetical protein
MTEAQAAVNPTYGRRSKIIDIILLASLSLGAFCVTARTALVPRDTTEGVAVIFAPWTTSDKTLLRAVAGGSRFVRFGGLPFIAIVMPESTKYVDRMLSAGAWLVVDPRALAACSSAFSSNPTKS